MKLLAIILLVVAMSAVSAPCQDTLEVEIGMSFTKIEGKTCVAVGARQHQAVSSMRTMISVMKRARAAGNLMEPDYEAKVSALFEHAKSLGVSVN